MNDAASTVAQGTVACDICPHECAIAPGAWGACGARTNVDGQLTSASYGLFTGVSLDPIEKKPLSYFHPGSTVLSVGSFGCNLTCPFCQNSDISMARGPQGQQIARTRVSPQQLVKRARRDRVFGNVGVAYTYNEPFVGFEFLRDAMPLVHQAGMLNVVVTNGYINQRPLLQLLPHIDALNIDLKGFRQEVYDRLGAPQGLDTVKRTIELAARTAHVEVTTLVVPGLNDSDDDMLAQARWLAGIDPDMPLHITRFFPRYKMSDASPTPVQTLQRLARVARQYLSHVELGNV